MCFMNIRFMIVVCAEKIESQYVVDPQMETLRKMTNDVIMKIKLPDKLKKSIKREDFEIMFREEGQILDLQLETKREKFKMKKVKSPKLFSGNLYR